MAEYLTVTSNCKTHIFEIVDKVPAGYVIWNIGRHNMTAGYLPLAKLKAVQPFEGAMHIETDTLKAIRIDGAELILDAIGYSQETVKEMERYVKRYRNAKGGYARCKVARFEKALPIMRQLKWA